MTCGLSKMKPDFKNKCPDFEISYSKKKYIPELITKIEEIKSNKKSVYFNFIISIGLSFIILFISYYLLKVTLEYKSLFSATMSLLSSVIGTTILSIAYGKLVTYKKRLNKIEKEKKKLDEILRNYQLNSETIVKTI